MSATNESESLPRKKLSAIIAVYRDAPAIPQMHARVSDTFKKIGVEYEIIFVNDCSPDNAGEVLADLARQDKKVVVINHSRNFGSQSGFTSGMRVATGDAVILMDGDLQDPPELIAPFYQKWQEGFDVVYGIRIKRAAPLWMQYAYKSFYRLFQAVSYVSIPVDAGDFSLIDRRVVDVLNNLPENNRFIRGLRAWAGFKQTGVPYVRPERPFGRTTNSLVRNIAWAQKGILSFSYVPLDAITWLALITVGMALLGAIALIIVRLLLPSASPSGFTTLILLILFMGGIQLLCLSIIGAYLAHIYDEVKHRPPFVVESILNNPADANTLGDSRKQPSDKHEA